MTTMISIILSGQLIKQLSYEQASSLYGEHQGTIFFQEDLSEFNEIQTDTLIGNVGLVETTAIDDLDVTIGWFDETALDISNLNLIEGQFPKESGEIAIEESYLTAFAPDWQLGEKRAITIDDRPHDYTLVGRVEDYSARWTVPMNVKRGIDDFPNFFIHHTEVQKSEKQEIVQHLIKFDQANPKKTEQFADLLTAVNYEGYLNSNLIYNGLIDYDNITMFSIMFSLVLFIILIIILYQLFSYYFIDYRKKLAIMRANGATKGDLQFILLGQLVFIHLLGFIISVPAVYVVTSIIVRASYFETISEDFNPINGIILCIFFYAIVFIFNCISIIYISSRENSTIIASIKGNRFNTTPHLKIFSNKPFIYTIIIKSYRLHLKRAIFIVLSIISIIFICFTTLVMSKEAEGVWIGEDDFYYLSADTGTSFIIKNKLPIFDQPFLFNTKASNIIEQSELVHFVDRDILSANITPLIKNEEQTASIQTWNEYHSMYYDVEEKHHSEVAPLIDGYSPLLNANIVTVNEEEYAHLYNYFFHEKEDYIKFRENSEAIMFFPGMSKKEGQQLEDLPIRFGKLAETETNRFEITSWDYKIKKVYTSEYTLPIADNVSHYREGVTFVIAEETAIQKGLIDGYTELFIYPRKGINELERLTLERQIQNLSFNIPGSMYQPMLEWLEEDRKIHNYLDLLISLLIPIILLVSSLVIFINLYSNFKLRKFEWGVYRAQGMSQNLMRLAIVSEIFITFLISALISTIPCLIFLSIFPTTYSFNVYVYQFLLSVSTVVLTLVLTSLLLLYNIMRLSIQQLLRDEE